MCEVDEVTICGSGTVFNQASHSCEVNSTLTPPHLESTHNQCEDGTYSNANTCVHDGTQLNSSTTCVCGDGLTVDGSQCVVGPLGCTSDQFWDNTAAKCLTNEFNIRFGSEQFPCNGSLVDYATTSFENGEVSRENHRTTYHFVSTVSNTLSDKLSIWLPSDSKLRFSKMQTGTQTVEFDSAFDFLPDNNVVPNLHARIRSTHCKTCTQGSANHQCGDATGYKCDPRAVWPKTEVSKVYDYTRPASHYYVSCVN